VRVFVVPDRRITFEILLFRRVLNGPPVARSAGKVAKVARSPLIGTGDLAHY
jgi:hypothetical protein